MLLRGMRDKPNVAKITSRWLNIIGICKRSCVSNNTRDFDLAMWSTQVDQFVNYGFQCASRASNGRNSRTLRSNCGLCCVFLNQLMIQSVIRCEIRSGPIQTVDIANSRPFQVVLGHFRNNSRSFQVVLGHFRNHPRSFQVVLGRSLFFGNYQRNRQKEVELEFQRAADALSLSLLNQA